ncbi:unnamed protein product [Heligmosomoides polygyrus]|uniref:Uncharacterized protein n=1 Tax=Heligmosomoides polygyrus TaxID=6339 RepID=A0A3P8AI10_HELPZ|nr:unnamed protein product [Heligmosomoides polygyrus]
MAKARVKVFHNFCDLNELIPNDSEKPLPSTPEMHKSKKKYAAPTVPEPVANTSSASTAPEVSTKSAKEVECQRDGEDFVRNGTNEDPEKRVTKEETTAAKQVDDRITIPTPHFFSG